MRSLLVLLAILCMAALGGSQNYSPKQGETVVKVAIEGRGNIFIRLHTDKAPRTCNHILDLVNSRFYDNQRVFAAEKSPRPFKIQLGDPLTKSKALDDPAIGTGGSGTRIPFEDSGYANDEGAVGLCAIPGDKNSGDSQFYILMSRASFLDGNYTVFGKVVAGMDVVKRVERGDRVLSVSVVR